MGFFSELGKKIKQTTDNLAKEHQRKQDILNTKRKILNRFEMNDLKKIVKDYGIGDPHPYETDFVTGKQYKIAVTREHFINKIMYEISLDQVKTFCEKNRIKIWDIVKEEAPSKDSPAEKIPEKQEIQAEPEPKVTTIEVKRQSEFDSILEAIEDSFEPEDVRDENDFEKQLTQFLKIKYPDRVKRQVETQKGKIDLVIDNKYAIELKIADGKGKLRDLVGQALFYKKIYPNLAIILLDVSKMSRSEIGEYVEEYRAQGVKTLILDGILRRRKGKSKQISIKY